MKVRPATDVTDGFGWVCLGCWEEWFERPLEHWCGIRPVVPFDDSPDGRGLVAEWRQTLEGVTDEEYQERFAT